MFARYTWSVRARLTLVSTVIVGVLCLSAAVLATLAVHTIITEQTADRVAATTRRIALQVERYGLARQFNPTPVEQVTLVQIQNSKDEVVRASAPLLGRPPLTTVDPTLTDSRATIETCRSPAYPGTCLIIVGFKVYAPDGEWTVYAADKAPPLYVGPGFLASLLGACALITGLTALGISRTVAKALAPVEDISSELADITSTDLGRRVPTPAYKDEIGHLATTVNHTLDRLQATVEQQRRFASDASHDLRSPITAMRAQVEESLLHPDDVDWPDTAGALLGSLDRLQAIVTDLLMLSRLDAGIPGQRDPVNLTEIVTAELDQRPTRRIEIVRDLQPDVWVTGDKLRLLRMLTNLLDNAERHAVAQARVSVAADGETAILEVLDDGAGIDPEHRETVFLRFTRLDAARNRDAGGTGLGLPIAREIAEAHGGILTVEDSTAGARFIVRLPLRRHNGRQ
ncbi:Signal transduction histidine kinase [Sinosporangium album]|uniref:histidine kinase n=1 Tax=Sinosporangium album TaxID=504805 RepID=A0A1G7TK67_9ACTN|nr:HAMP domain-containing sensor histidine kinase [Sinosporangium album]SDG35727.1 Signal transduction histidine kinase [Sinosporangium album]